MPASSYVKKILFSGCLWGGAAGAQAQSTAAAPSPYSTVSIASPTAASLGKFADVPVSYHTGLPEVSVPLYAVQEGPLALAIGLSYHAGGVKVLEPAGWVGTGWALNAGGVITRSVLGAPDERGTTNATHGHFSDYGFSSYLTLGGDRNQTPYSTSRLAPNDGKFANSLYDGEPDLFFFNFNGFSGKFYFSDDRTPVVVDGQDLKIAPYYPNPAGAGVSAANNIQGFTVTVPTGDRYYFGNTGDLPAGAVAPVELTYPYSGYSSFVDNKVYSSYYLSKVVAADGVHALTFTYAAEQYSYYTLSTFPILGADASTSLQKEFALVKNNIDGVRLANIHFSTGDVRFNAAAVPRTDLGAFLDGGLDDVPNAQSQSPYPARALDNVTVTTTDQKFCKKFAFAYSYFGGDATPLSEFLATSNVAGIQTDKTRLKLESVVEQSCDGRVKANPWVFTYNGTFLPRRLSFAQDHWGYYNGANGNNQLNTLIPAYTISAAATASGALPGPGTLVPGANRDADSTAMAAGVLTQVTYPTGGSAVFALEANDVWVAYAKWDYLPPVTLSASKANFAHAFNYYTFSATSAYKLAVDYQRAAGCSNSDPATALFGFGVDPDGYAPDTVLLGSSPAYPHNELTFAPGAFVAKRRRLRLDISSGCNDLAQASLQEVVRRNVQEHALVGGLRLRALTLKESATAAGTVTRYAYRHPSGHSSGVLYNRPYYVQTVRNRVLARYGYTGDDGATHPEASGCLNPAASPFKTYLKSPCGIRPLATTQGSHIGYDVVTATKPGNGRTEYHYAFTGAGERTYADVCVRTIDPALCDPAVPSQPAAPAPYEYDRGQLKYQGDYNAQGQVVKTTSYQHVYDSTRVVTPAYLAKYVAGAGLTGAYGRRGYWQTKSVVTETLYDPQAPAHTQAQVQYFASPFHHQLTRSLQTTSGGDTLETRNRYASDVRTPAPDALADGNAAYNAACASCDAAFLRQLANCTTSDCRRDAYLDSLVCRAAARTDYVAYRRRTFTDGLNTFQARHDAAKSAADGSLRPVLQLQDDGRNPVVETSQWRNRRLLSASYTAFGPGLSQPAVLYPAQQFGLFLPAPAPTFAPAVVSGNQVQRDARYAAAPETTLTFDNGALVEVLPKAGIVTAYLWGYGNTLPVAKAVGVRYAALRTAYANRGGDLAALRSDPGLARALLTTYAHQPLVGLLRQTDPAGRPVTYEYDGLGRLVRTRDEQGHILAEQQYHYAGQ